MKNSFRCWISCILPCGAFDVVRVVHSNGVVEEYDHKIKAGDIMKKNPNFVVRNPSASSEYDHGNGPKIAILPLDAELRRGKIYFLVPISSLPEKTRPRSVPRRRRRREHHGSCPGNSISIRRVRVSDQYLTDILSEKISTTSRNQSKGRVGIWRPYLDSIDELDPCIESTHPSPSEEWSWS